MSDNKKIMRDLTLALLYVSGWEEDSKKEPGTKIFRAWKGFLFEVLDYLEEQKLVVQFRTRDSKSLILTEDGIRRARALIQKYNV